VKHAREIYLTIYYCFLKLETRTDKLYSPDAETDDNVVDVDEAEPKQETEKSPKVWHKGVFVIGEVLRLAQGLSLRHGRRDVGRGGVVVAVYAPGI
jgi:hypothetical protein